MISSIYKLFRSPILTVTLIVAAAFSPVFLNGQGFGTVTALTPLTVVKNTGEKPQSKVWNYSGTWWSVFPNSTGTYIWRLDGTVWTSMLKLTSSTTVKADCKVVGNVSHILLWRKETSPSQLISVQHVPASNVYQLWSQRTATALITLDAGVEIGTIDIDANGRMWLASDGTTDIRVRWSDSPYSTWSAPIIIATGITDDDICSVINMPVQGKTGVFWSDQSSKRFGFKTHVNGADPSVWSVDEVPASQSALNIGTGMGDDHLNLAMAADGTLFCAVKTGYDTPGYPLLSLLKRQPNGSWDNLYKVSETGTRPIVKLNEAIGKVKVFYTALEEGGNIAYKESDMTNISFGSEMTMISGFYNNPSSSKNNYSGEVLVLGSNDTQVVGALGSDQQVVAVPSIPTLLSPANLATAVPSNPILSWSPSVNANSYQVQVSNLSDFSSLLEDQSGLLSSSFQVNGLASGMVYHWRVRATNQGGNSNWSGSFSFTTIPPLPAVPTLVSPINLSTDVVFAPTLSWGASSHAISYQAQISSLADFSTTVTDQIGIVNPSVQINGLANNAVYYWRVRAVNSAGQSNWSAVWSFTVVPLPPPSPALLNPANLLVEVALNPTLGWSASANASTYQVQVSALSDFSTIIFNQNVSGTTTQANGLMTNSIYHWRVRAINSGGSSNWSSVWSFTTVPLAPTVPVLVSPVDMASSVTINPTLNWATASNANSYEIQVSSQPDFTSTIVNQSGILTTTFPLNGLSANTIYYWRVASTNSIGNSGWSGAWSFSTIAPPSTPALTSPIDISINISTSPILSWEASPNAATYHVQLSALADFSDLILNQSNLSATSIQVSGLMGNGVYYWRARAANSIAISNWSSAWSFTTILQIPSVPALVSPASLASEVAINPTLSWDPSSYADSYRVQVSTFSDFSTTLIDQSGIGITSLQLNGLAINTAYHWRALATNLAGSSSWSITRSFTTVAPPQAPTLSSPTNLAGNVAINPILYWNTIANANSYQVQVSVFPDFSSTVFDQSEIATNSVQISGLLINASYYWRVRATNATGISNWSVVWSFSTVSPPSVPQLNAPGDLATGIPVNSLLSWIASVNATSYQVQVSFVSNFSSTVLNLSGITGTSQAINGMLRNTIHFWRVRATNNSGNSDWSIVRSFTTIGNNLVGNWKMNEGSGSTLTDESGFGNNASTIGGPTWVAGVNGSAVRLNGTNQNATIPNSPSLQDCQTITIAAWIKPERNASQRIVQKGISTDGYVLFLLSTGKVSFQINQVTSTTLKLNSKASYPSNGLTWMHVAATYNGSIAKIYINGVENKSITFSPAPMINTNTAPVTIGSTGNGSSNFMGAIDGVRIYNYPLTGTDISGLASLANAPSNARINVSSTQSAENISPISSNEIKVYPNPASKIISLELPEMEGEVFLAISNPMGKVHFTDKAVPVQGKIEIDLDNLNLSNGVYLVTIRSDAFFKVVRFIKE